MRIHRDNDQAAGPLFAPVPRQVRIRTRTPHPLRMLQALGASLRRGVQWLAWRRHVAALQRLDDATLKDIGVLRMNIESYVAEHHAIARSPRCQAHEDPWVCDGSMDPQGRPVLRETDIYR